MKLSNIIKILIIIILIISILYIIWHWFITNISEKRISILGWIMIIYNWITGKKEGFSKQNRKGICVFGTVGPGCQKK